MLVVIAMSIGVFELVIARALRSRGHVVDEWLLGLAGAVSVGFALVLSDLDAGRDRNEHRRFRIGHRASPAKSRSCCGRMASWPSRSSVGGFCFGVFRS